MDQEGGLAADLRRLNIVPSDAIRRLRFKAMNGGMDVSIGRVSEGPQGGNGGRNEHPGRVAGVRVGISVMDELESEASPA